MTRRERHDVVSYQEDELSRDKMPVYKQQLTTDQAGFRFAFTECMLAASWLILGVTWGVVSAANAPLFVCLLFTWIFGTYGVLGLFLVTPLMYWWAHKHDVFE